MGTRQTANIFLLARTGGSRKALTLVNNVSLDVSHLPRGLYLVRVTREGRAEGAHRVSDEKLREEVYTLNDAVNCSSQDLI